MKNAVIPNSPYAQISLEPLRSQIDSIVPLGDVLIIAHHGFHAEISLYGGQVIAFQHHHLQAVEHEKPHPIFWRTNTIHCGKSSNGTDTAIRGGVPICWPWFGPHPEDEGEKHGFARNLLWQLTHVDITKEQVTVTLELSSHNEHALWQQPFTLRQQLIFSIHNEKAFQQTLVMNNHSNSAVQYTGAFHNYFSVSSPENTQVNALSHARYYDQLLEKECSASQLPHCEGPIDRIYYREGAMLHEDLLIDDIGWQRTLRVNTQHCNQWVLWNPGSNDAKQMSDVHANGEQEFVCVESANTQWQTIPANGTASISQTVSIINNK